MGDHILLFVDGFSAQSVTISLCGNEARRGSADCDMVDSQSLQLHGDGATTAALAMAAPPAPCPCIVRVSDITNDEVAVAPITLTGHPVAPVVDPPAFSNPLVVAISAHAAPDGLGERIRADLGGATTYEVTVRVRNSSTITVHKVALRGQVGRTATESLVPLPLMDPGDIAAGQTWQQVVTVKVPAPAFGSLLWSAAASGFGPSVTGTTTTRHRPTLLIIVLSLLVIDVFVLLIRWRIKKRRRRETALAAAPLPEGAVIDTDAHDDDLVPSA